MGSRQKLNTRTFSSPFSRRRATSLIEVIIASAFVLLIATGAMELSIRVMREHATVSRQGELDSESMLVLQAVMHDLTAAQRIETASTSATLSLRTKDATGKTWDVQYSLRDERIERSIVESSGGQKINQVLAGHASEFAVERKGSLLHVVVNTKGSAMRQEMESRLETDFYTAGLLPTKGEPRS